eukprot:359660-Chlamydomonas_euryale.AAC.6
MLPPGRSEHRVPVRCLNHVSRVCADVEKAAAFYRDLGFSDCRRPTSFDFDGAWCGRLLALSAACLAHAVPIPTRAG